MSQSSSASYLNREMAFQFNRGRGKGYSAEDLPQLDEGYQGLFYENTPQLAAVGMVMKNGLRKSAVP
jgi:hypothetical protein